MNEILEKIAQEAFEDEIEKLAKKAPVKKVKDFLKSFIEPQLTVGEKAEAVLKSLPVAGKAGLAGGGLGSTAGAIAGKLKAESQLLKNIGKHKKRIKKFNVSPEDYAKEYKDAGALFGTAAGGAIGGLGTGTIAGALNYSGLKQSMLKKKKIKKALQAASALSAGGALTAGGLSLAN